MPFFKNKKPTLGVWIADHTIEIALVADVKGGAALISHARKAIKKGVVERGRIKRPRDLADTFENLLNSDELETVNLNEVNVVFGLQNCVAKTHVFTLPPHRRSETARLVHKEILRTVNVTTDNLAYDYRATDEGEGVNVVAVTTTNEILDEWQSFFSSIDIVLEEITVESMAQFRALFANEPEGATCLVDLGQQETTVSIYAHHNLLYHYALSFGGDTLTKAYGKAFKLTPAKAEAHKIKMGIGCGDDEEHAIAVGELEPVVKEIKNALQLYKKFEGEDPTEIVLVGGTAFLKGLVEYLNDKLDVAVRVGQSVFAAQLKPHKLPGSASRTSGIRGATEQEVYLQAIGFALMGVDPYWSDMHPSFVLTDTGAPEPVKSVTFGAVGWSALIIVLALGAGAGWVYWQERQMLAEPIVVETEVFTTEQLLSLDVVIEVGGAQPGDVKGRVIRTPRTTTSSTSEAIKSSFTLAEEQLNTGEVLLETPLGEGTDGESKPIFDWLAYDEVQLESAYRAMIDILNTEQKPYTLSEVNPVQAEKLGDESYKLTADIVLVVDELLSLETSALAIVELETETEPEIEEPIYEIPAGAPRVEVQKTSIGHLNARSAPTTSSEVVEQLLEGDVYEFIEEDQYGWVHIRLDADRTAWVSGLYVSEP